MYSFEERLRTVELYIKLGKRPKAGGDSPAELSDEEFSQRLV
jgi:hypothetical protein